MTFTQTLDVHTRSVDDLTKLVRDWHNDQSGTAPGYRAARILADRGRRDHYTVEVDFASETEAARNNDRAETQRWATAVRRLAEAEPEYRDYDVLFSTGS